MPSPDSWLDLASSTPRRQRVDCRDMPTYLQRATYLVRTAIEREFGVLAPTGPYLEQRDFGTPALHRRLGLRASSAVYPGALQP